MKKNIRSFLRNSKYAAAIMRTLSLSSLPEKWRNKFINAYLQSEAERPGLASALGIYIERVKLKEPRSTLDLTKSAIIKAPVGDEKGIILVGFEHKLDELISYVGIHDLIQRYDVLFMPTWQPFYSFSLLRALKILKRNLVILPSSENCYYKALALPQCFNALPFHASSWVNEVLYTPKQKDIDILMVANFSIYKRHTLLFEALVDMPRHLNVVLIGRPLEDRTAKDILAEAAHYGVQDRFTLIEAPSNETVVDHLCRAKLVLGLSGREGSYVSLAEALFADAAVAVFANAHIGTKNYINPRTGFLLQPDLPLASQIMQCLGVVETLSPRDWAVKNISAQVNVMRLNKLLAHKAKVEGTPWQFDCDPFHIQSFYMAPIGPQWSEAVQNEIIKLKEKGLNFKNQTESLQS